MGARTDELHTLGSDPQAAHLAATLLVIPLVKAKTTFDKDWGATVQVVATGFGLLAPDIDIYEASIFALLAAGSGVFPTGGQAYVTNPRTATGIPEVRIAGEVADEIDFVEAGHEMVLLSDGLGVEGNARGAIILEDLKTQDNVVQTKAVFEETDLVVRQVHDDVPIGRSIAAVNRARHLAATALFTQQQFATKIFDNAFNFRHEGLAAVFKLTVVKDKNAFVFGQCCHV